MFSVLHPLLLWGAGAVAAPILIHLLLRQRPKPRPWAAMRWLMAALHKAQRRYKLTNLLLLLLRCLVVLLLALAVARPSLAGLGRGGKLVLFVDVTASMGARGGDPGPLAQAKAALAGAKLPRRVAVVAVGATVEPVVDGTPETVLGVLARVSARPLPGGLDRAADAVNAAAALAAVGEDADVVLVSDFQQDEGRLLEDLLRPHVRSVGRWAVGGAGPNALVKGFDELPDLLPGRPGELAMVIDGSAGPVKVAVDGGPSVPAPASAGGQRLRLALPPLDVGEHRVDIEFADGGLVYDNRLELRLTLQQLLPTLSVEDRADFLSAALKADEKQQLSFERVRPAALATTQLPPRGVVALRARIADGERLRRWVEAGGVLWSAAPLLREDPVLAPLIAGLAAQADAVPGGSVTPALERDRDIAWELAPAKVPEVPAVALPAKARVLLRAGEAPLVVAMPAGRGVVVVELTPLAGDAPWQRELENRAMTPTWVRRTVRELASRVEAPLVWTAGSPAPQDATLRRDGVVAKIVSGEQLLLAPGCWSLEGGNDVVVLPSPAEGRLDRPQPAEAVAAIDRALPREQGSDWGLWLLLAAVAVALGEGLLAAWAGRTYGR